MLADDFEGIRDAGEIDRFVPRKQKGQINKKLPGLMFGESDPEPFGGRNKELAQGTLMFHVEQLREMIREVKG